MGTMMSRLDAQQSKAYVHSVNVLLGVIRQQDKLLAQLIERATKSSDFDLTELSRHVKSNSVCSDHSSQEPTSNGTKQPPRSVDGPASNETDQTSKPVDDKKSEFQAFQRRFEQREPAIRDVLQANFLSWREVPMSFWGFVDPLSCLTLSDAVRGLNGFVDNAEENEIVNPIRRRLSLVMLHQIQAAVENRVEHMVRTSGIKVQRGATFKSISITIVSTFFEPTRRRAFVGRLRAGERYSRLPSGVLLALGNVPHDGMERGCIDEFYLMKTYCEKFSPDWVTQLGDLATVLKNSIWDHGFDRSEFNTTVDSYLCQTTSTDASKENDFHAFESCTPNAPLKRKDTEYGNPPRKTRKRQGLRERNTLTTAEQTATHSQCKPLVNRNTNSHGATHRSMGAAISLSTSSSPEQGQHHGSQEATADNGNNSGSASHISNSSQEPAIINQRHNPENGTRQINASLPFDLETREVLTEIELSPPNGNLQGLNSHLGGATILNACAQHFQYSNIESLENPEELSASNNVSSLNNPTDLNHALIQRRSDGSSLVEGRKLTCTSTSAESTSMQSVAIGHLPFELDMNRGAFVGTPNPAVEGTISTMTQDSLGQWRGLALSDLQDPNLGKENTLRPTDFSHGVKDLWGVLQPADDAFVTPADSSTVSSIDRGPHSNFFDFDDPALVSGINQGPHSNLFDFDDPAPVSGTNQGPQSDFFFDIDDPAPVSGINQGPHSNFFFFDTDDPAPVSGIN